VRRNSRVAGRWRPCSLSLGVRRSLRAKKPSPGLHVSTIAYRKKMLDSSRGSVSVLPVSAAQGEGMVGAVPGLIRKKNARAPAPTRGPASRRSTSRLGSVTEGGAVPFTSNWVVRTHAGRSLLILRNASVAASASSRIAGVRRMAPRRAHNLGGKRKTSGAREPSWILHSLPERRRRRGRSRATGPAPIWAKPEGEEIRKSRSNQGPDTCPVPHGRRRDRIRDGQGRCAKDEHLRSPPNNCLKLTWARR